MKPTLSQTIARIIEIHRRRFIGQGLNDEKARLSAIQETERTVWKIKDKNARHLRLMFVLDGLELNRNACCDAESCQS